MVKHVEHCVVLRQRLGPKRRNPSLPGRLHQLIEQEGTDTVVLVLIGHHEGHLCVGLSGLAIEATHRDQAVVDLGHQRQPIDSSPLG